MAEPIFGDVFFTERPQMSFVDLNIILNRNSNEFCLMASKDDRVYRVKVSDVYLKICKVKVSPRISMARDDASKK